jgi:hypothetical protein
MTCQDVTLATPDYLTGEIDAETASRVRAHLADCASCREELEGLSETWTRLGVLADERPSPRLRESFYAMLEAHPRDVDGDAPLTGRPVRLRAWRVAPRWALASAAAVLAIGLGFGLGLWTRSAARGPGAPEVAQMRTEIDGLRQQVSLALIGQSSAGERLRGVALVSQVRRPEESLLTGLLELVDNDPNVNVRLSAVDALYLFSGNPRIREGLARSLQRQTSPVVQIALIDLIVGIREKQAAEALRKLVDDQRVRPEVRQRARSAIEKIL